MSGPIELLALDAHGVVLNNPFVAFLSELAEAAGLPAAEVGRRWREELHDPAWRGAIDDATVWRRLSGHRLDPRACAARLEHRYAPGPAAPHLAAWEARSPICILSNHRHHWLEPRLERLDLARHFRELLVSDRIGALKPDPAAFAPLLRRIARPGAILFVDDKAPNVAAARRLGMRAVHARPDVPWVEQVTGLLGRSAIERPVCPG